MSPVPNDAPEPYLVLAAWHCDTCDVQGRSPGAEVECWNCGGPVTVTARPVLRTRRTGTPHPNTAC